jgi:hypothetical protein
MFSDESASTFELEGPSSSAERALHLRVEGRGSSARLAVGSKNASSTSLTLDPRTHSHAHAFEDDEQN